MQWSFSNAVAPPADFPAGSSSYAVGGTRLLASRAWTWVSFGLLLGLQLGFFYRWRVPYVTDDAAFFLRYAENLAAGHGFRWNVEEPPIWGASAPLWPLLLAVGVRLGFTALGATYLFSVLLLLGATLLLGMTVRRHFGNPGVLALAALLPSDHLYTAWATAGLESPLTYFVLALVLFLANVRTRGVGYGLAAGLCLVHKVDVAPIGLLLLGGVALWRRDQFLLALGVAGALALSWYGFATWHFGSPVPNSFLMKLGADYGDLPRSWFLRKALLDGAWGIRLSALLAGVIALRHRRWLLLTACGVLLVPALAYTLRPPPEEFLWYVAAISGTVSFLTACGLASCVIWALGERAAGPWLAPAAFLAIGVLHTRGEWPMVRFFHAYQNWAEPGRIRAGQWVNENLPGDARLWTRWGHPAYAARRFTYDGSGLNRRLESRDLIALFEPEALVDLFQVPLEEYPGIRGYRVVAVFSSEPSALISVQNHAAVLLRSDVRTDLPDLQAQAVVPAPAMQVVLQRLADGSALNEAERERACSFLKAQEAHLSGMVDQPEVVDLLRRLRELCSGSKD